MTKRFRKRRPYGHYHHARRAAFIIDGADYFRAVRQAMRRARRSIFIVGWDLHSGLRLMRDGDDGYPEELGDFLNALAAERKHLHIYILNWDFAMIYAMEREFFPRYKLQWRTHNRLHFSLDGHHPLGASQHQKIVVVDDVVAFAGGLDLSQWRWDSSSHHPHDDRRRDPEGNPYPPFHDVQMVVDGKAAAALGKIVKTRWERSEREKPKISRRVEAGDPWPDDLQPDFQDIHVLISQTLPRYQGQPEIRQVEKLYLKSLAAARRYIYIENQYLSSYRVGEALKERLQEPDGPEIILVLPEETGGWLEQHTMDVLRGRLLQKLREADYHDRLRVYYPRLATDPHCALMVHAKVMVIDDTFARVGSSNLSNRSLGLDSECDLAVSTRESHTDAVAIADFRNRLLAEHLDTTAAEVSRAVEHHQSLIAATESLQNGERTLVPLSGEVPPEVDQWIPEGRLLDPEKPVEPDQLVEYLVSPEQRPAAYRPFLSIGLLLAAMIGLILLWHWSPVAEWSDVDSARRAAEWVRHQPLTPLLVIAAYVAGSLLAFPVTVMITATTLVFGPWQGALYALLGSQISALILFAAGRLLGRRAVRRIAGSILNRVSQKISASGFLTVMTFRLVPVAPFTAINMIAGVSEIRWRDYIAGTFLGMLPGIAAISLLTNRVKASIAHPDPATIGILLISILAVILGLVGLRRWVQRKDRRILSSG